MQRTSWLLRMHLLQQHLLQQHLRRSAFAAAIPASAKPAKAASAKGAKPGKSSKASKAAAAAAAAAAADEDVRPRSRVRAAHVNQCQELVSRNGNQQVAEPMDVQQQLALFSQAVLPQVVENTQLARTNEARIARLEQQRLDDEARRKQDAEYARQVQLDDDRCRQTMVRTFQEHQQNSRESRRRNASALDEDSRARREVIERQYGERIQCIRDDAPWYNTPYQGQGCASGYNHHNNPHNNPHFQGACPHNNPRLQGANASSNQEGGQSQQNGWQMFGNAVKKAVSGGK